MSRLTIEITEQQHQHIKALAALHGKSIKEYVMQKLLSPSHSDTQTTQETELSKLRAHLAIGETQANRGEFADYSLEKLKDEVSETYRKRKQKNGKI